jgi:hypothetical protein
MGLVVSAGAPAIAMTDPPNPNPKSQPSASTLSLTKQHISQVPFTPMPSDPELGILRLRETEPQRVEDLTIQDTLDAVGDPELGNLRLRDRPIDPIPDPPTVFAFATVDYFRSDNILLDARDPVNDGIFRSSVGLFAVPELSEDTLLIAAVEGSLSRYGDLTDLDYNDIRVQTGLRHYFSNDLYASLDWTHSQLFDKDEGDRFLTDNAVRLALDGQLPLSDRTEIEGFYQVRFSFSDPSDRSRMVHSIGTALNHELADDLTASLDYRLNWTDFLERDRQDTSHQIVAELTYDLNDVVRFIVFGGYSLGQSSEPTVDFDGTVFGVGIDLQVPLF